MLQAGHLMRLLDMLKGDELPLQRLRLERLAMLPGYMGRGPDHFLKKCGSGRRPILLFLQRISEEVGQLVFQAGFHLDRVLDQQQSLLQR